MQVCVKKSTNKVCASVNQTARRLDLSPESTRVLETAEAKQLLAQIASGDENAYEKLYRQVSRSVFAFVMQRCGDASLAEEIVVDTLVEVWKHPDRFRGESKFSTWLLSIARFKMIDRLRAAPPAHDDIETVADTLADENSDSAFMRLHEQQQRQGIEKCMQRLSDEHREALHLVYFEELPLADVAQMQNVPENTVKTRLFNARHKLRDCLASLMAPTGSARSTA
jgi:RNA polymerase sigma-70 factor, ECF subfamily